MMSETKPSAEALKQALIERVAECRRRLPEEVMSLDDMEKDVLAYCMEVAALPPAESRLHMKDLEMLLRELTELKSELTAARDSVQGELASLGKLRQASVAYHKSDAILPPVKKKEEDE